jgi:hypothetical protein
MTTRGAKPKDGSLATLPSSTGVQPGLLYSRKDVLRHRVREIKISLEENCR